MSNDDLTNLTNLNDIPISTLKEYLADRERREGISEGLKTNTEIIHTLFCNKHEGDFEGRPCHYPEEQGQENTWAKMCHREWLTFTQALLEDCKLSSVLGQKEVLQDLAIIIGTIENHNEAYKESLSKLVKEWIDYTYPQ